ncbi:hypothetical protein [Aristophania vespae]|uniref:hypothetical protein n=1 Tax=Aristophania vespae TaxID=2697033 RepID=UPI0023510918|nr:hypothetical protein [Aristophania vespae]UMM63099.1 hypothetical protein DM15PD_00530 [Aristophania vespae]
MTHPLVYQDAWKRTTNACKSLNMDLRDILTQDVDDHDRPWVLFETASSSEDRLGLGSELYQETGQIWLHLMAPRGTGALSYIQNLAVLAASFRTPTTTQGLTYLAHHADPPNSDTTGNWATFSLAVDYEFQTKLSQ